MHSCYRYAFIICRNSSFSSLAHLHFLCQLGYNSSALIYLSIFKLISPPVLFHGILFLITAHEKRNGIDE